MSAALESSDESKLAKESLVHERYRVEAMLGHGGMAAVYRVLDERTGQQLALKQLTHTNPAVRAMFEREYHTLVQLAHPRIVHVFDYGHDARGPFYTMELLEGGDLRASLHETEDPAREVCSLLRDVASALALIHSRRLVHRDVSPRNIWRTPDGRAKLIDFGTLAAMGVQNRLAGTPPCMPPEALHGQELDGRTDLYALGALGYFLLTGQHAYAARRVADLRQLWQRPPTPPATLNSKVPGPVSALMMALLSLDPRGRPGSAAEVVDRLNALCAPPPDDEQPAAQAYLSTPKLVGRDAPSMSFRKRLLRAVRGRGGALMMVAPSGMGRSRMLSNCVLEAKLLGATVASADAGTFEPAPLSMACALAEQTLELAPGLSALAGPNAALLSHLSPALHQALGTPALVELEAQGRTHRLGDALFELFTAVGQKQCLLLAVDNVDQADQASAVLLGRLSEVAPAGRLMLLSSCEPQALDTPSSPLRALSESSAQVELTPLSQEQTRALLQSVFGDAPGLDATVSWLHELSHGSPGACMDYAQHLIDHGLARYESGRFKLPEKLSDQPLPKSLDAMLDARVAALSNDARALALGLALTYDETRPAWQAETRLRIEDYSKLLDVPEPARVFGALDQLVRAEVLLAREDHYAYAQRALILAVRRAAPIERQQAMYARLALVLEQGAYPNRALHYLCLLRGGHQARAIELMVEQLPALATPTGIDWSQTRNSAFAYCYKQALEHCEKNGGTPLQQMALQKVLLLLGAGSEWSVGGSPALFTQLEHDTGLIYFSQTDPARTPGERLMECFSRAQADYERLPVEHRGLSPAGAVRDLVSYGASASLIALSSADVQRSRYLSDLTEPLRYLGPVMAVLCDCVRRGRDRAIGRELGDSESVLALTLFSNDQLPEVFRNAGAGMLRYAKGIEDARRGCSSERAIAQMEGLVSGSARWMFDHRSWLSHAFAGDGILAEQFCKRAEIVLNDDVWRRKAWLFVEVELYALTGDLVRLQRVLPPIAELAEAFPGWRPWHAWAQGELQRMFGEFAAARRHFELALQLAPAGEHRAWVVVQPAYASLLLAQGELEAARACALEAIETTLALDLDRTAAIYSGRVLSLCESRLGHHEAAVAALDRAFELAKTIEMGGLPLATLYEAQTEIALHAGDHPAYRGALRLFSDQIRHAHAPALVARCEVLAQEDRRGRGTSLPVADDALTTFDVARAEPELLTRIRTVLGEQPTQDQRARRALELLLEDCRAKSGLLYLLRAEGPGLAATINTRGSMAMQSFVEQYLEAEATDAGEVTVTIADIQALDASGRQGTWIDPDGKRYVPVLLWNRGGSESVIAGLALLCAPDATNLQMPQPELVWAISRCLHDTGDVLGVRRGS